jgi:hypothetical protein
MLEIGCKGFLNRLLKGSKVLLPITSIKEQIPTICWPGIVGDSIDQLVIAVIRTERRVDF